MQGLITLLGSVSAGTVLGFQSQNDSRARRKPARQPDADASGIKYKLVLKTK